MALRRFLITGATGKQGGAVLDSLLAKNASTHFVEILALTRRAESPRAKELASKPHVTLVQGDLGYAEAIFEKTGSVDAVFCVTVPGKDGAEEAQAKPLIDASIVHGVKHFIFTSVDRGGSKLSDQTPTNIPHFASKHRIEAYLKERAGQSDMSWTILRPVAFMDGLTPDFMGKAFATMWAGLGSRRLQLVSTKDIGHFGAAALLEPEKYQGQAIGLAGDELSYDEACKVFKQTMGFDIPTTFAFIGTGIMYIVKEIGTMFGWFSSDGYKVDIKALRKQYPELQDFKEWLEQSSKFEKR